MVRLMAATLLAILVGACAHQDGAPDTPGSPGGPEFAEMTRGPLSYRAFDAADRVVCEGRLTLAWSTRDSFTGSWHALAAGPPVEIGPQVGRGELAGGVEPGGRIWMNLNPSMADNNVFLHGFHADGRITGEWTYVTFAGIRTRGRFEAVR